MINWKREAKIIGLGSAAIFFMIALVCMIVLSVYLLSKLDASSFLVIIIIPLAMVSIRAAFIVCDYCTKVMEGKA